MPSSVSSTAPPTAAEGRSWRSALLPALAFATFATVATARAGLRGDLRAHLRFAENFAQVGGGSGTYPLFSQVTVIVRTLVPWDVIGLAGAWPTRRDTWTVSGLLVAWAATAWTFALVARRLADPDRAPRRAQTAWLTAGVLLLAPIAAPTLLDRGLYDGYLVPSAFDNGTYLVLRPFALVLFGLVVTHWAGADRRTLAITAAVAVVCPLAKPSFTICLIPAVVLVALVRSRRRQPVAVRYLALGLVVPSLVVLALQALVSRDQHLGSIELAPFATLRDVYTWIDVPLAAWPALVVLSCALPLAVAATGGRAARQDLGLQLGWVAFAFGLAYLALFRVAGRPDYGELVGAPQIALLLLQVESTRFAWRRGLLGWSGGRAVLVSSVFAIQVLFGLGFWFSEVAEPLRWH